MNDVFANLLATLALARELCVTDEEKQEFDARLDEALNYKSPNIQRWTPGEPLTEDSLLQKPAEKPPVKHWYEFSGTWNWGTYATSEQDARDIFFSKGYNELMDEMDVELDHFTVEEDD